LSLSPIAWPICFQCPERGEAGDIGRPAPSPVVAGRGRETGCATTPRRRTVEPRAQGLTARQISVTLQRALVSGWEVKICFS